MTYSGLKLDIMKHVKRLVLLGSTLILPVLGIVPSNSESFFSESWDPTQFESDLGLCLLTNVRLTKDSFVNSDSLLEYCTCWVRKVNTYQDQELDNSGCRLLQNVPTDEINKVFIFN